MVGEKMVIDIDNLSEEGELKRSPDKQNFSDDDADTQDSLEIKPPQAVIHHKKSSSHRRDKHLERSGERRNKEYKSSRHHDDRHHREKHRESRYRRHEPDQYEKTRRSEPTKRDRDSSRYERKERSTGDRVLEDLRERLLDKRRERRDESRDHKVESLRSGESRREESSSHRRVVITAEDPRELQQQQQQRSSNGRHSMRYSDPIREKRHKRSHKHERTKDREKEMAEREIAHREKRLREQHEEDEEDEEEEEEEDEQSMEVDDYDDPRPIEPEHHRYQQTLPPPKDPKDMTEQELRRQRLIDADREMALMKKNSYMALEARRQKRGGDKRSHSPDDEMLDPSIVHLSEDESEEKTDRSSSARVSSADRSEDSSDDSSSSTDTGTESTESHSTRSRSESEHLRSPEAKSDDPQSPEPIEENKSNGVIKEDEKKEDEREIEPEIELPPYFPAIQGCRNVEEYKCLNRIAEGTYGVVYRAEDKRTKEIVALKRLKMEKEKEGFPITSLREINTLLKAQHPNIVTVREIVVGSNMDKIFIVMDFIEHDLKSLMETMKSKNQVFIPGEVKCLMQQLLKAVAHLHDNWILHRDLKTSNLLLSHKGILKVGDFGLAREYGSPLKRYTSIVVTLWYRAPELLLGSKEYSTPVDMWSVGCIFAELLRMEALFPGKSETDLLNRVFKELGTPNDKIWPGYSDLPLAKKMVFAHYPVNNLRQRFGMSLTELGYNLLNKLLTYDPKQRITAEDAVKHDYFTESPLPIDPTMFPTWPAKSEFGVRTANASPKPPSGGKEFKQLGDDDDNAIGFHMGSRETSRQLPAGGGFHLKF